MGSLPNIDFGACWGGSGKKRVPGKFHKLYREPVRLEVPGISSKIPRLPVPRFG